MHMDITEHDVQFSVEYDIPQQETSCDCGVYVCEYAEKLTRDSVIYIEKMTYQKYVKE